MMQEIMDNTVLEFECIGMDSGSRFPVEYTGRGQDISPEFVIKNLSPNAKTLAVTLEDYHTRLRILPIGSFGTFLPLTE